MKQEAAVYLYRLRKSNGMACVEYDRPLVEGVLEYFDAIRDHLKEEFYTLQKTADGRCVFITPALDGDTGKFVLPVWQKALRYGGAKPFVFYELLREYEASATRDDYEDEDGLARITKERILEVLTDNMDPKLSMDRSYNAKKKKDIDSFIEDLCGNLKVLKEDDNSFFEDEDLSKTYVITSNILALMNERMAASNIQWYQDDTTGLFGENDGDDKDDIKDGNKEENINTDSYEEPVY